MLLLPNINKLSQHIQCHQIQFCVSIKSIVQFSLYKMPRIEYLVVLEWSLMLSHEMSCPKNESTFFTLFLATKV